MNDRARPGRPFQIKKRKERRGFSRQTDMLDFFYGISIPMQKNRLLNKAAFVWNRFVRFLMRKLYPGYCRRHPVTSGVTEKDYGAPVIISFTSFPARMKTIASTIESIMRQTMKPNKIILWLTEDENPGQKIPAEVQPFLNAGLEVRFSRENLKPHNKSFHTAALYPDSFIITVDDDVLYSESLVKRLFDTYRKSEKKTVVCEMAHEIRIGEDGKPKDYDQCNWESIGISGPSHLLLAKGVSGVLYPPGFFADEYFDLDAIKENCLMADDLWLKFMELVRGYKVKKTRAWAKNVYTSSKASQKVSLTAINNGENRNNLYLSKLIEKYPAIDWKHLN